MKTKPLFDRAKARLSAAKIPQGNIKTHLPLLDHQRDLVAEIIKAAGANQCGTVVVGKSSYPWMRELFHTHLSEQLVSGSTELAVCVVNEQAPAA